MKHANRIIIIPAYNEGGHIAAVIQGIKQYSDADVIVIDDGSEDQTAEKAQGAGAKLIRHPFNMGYGVALQSGYKYAAERDYDYLIQMDGDNQHDPKHIPEFFEKIQALPCDVLIGSRFLGRTDYRIGALKLVAIKFFRNIIRMVTGARITDPTSGYQCLNRKVYTLFTHDSFPWDYPDANIIIMLLRMGFKVAEIPVRMVVNHRREGMHRGLGRMVYYLFKVMLSILMAMLRQRSYYPREEFQK